MYTHEVTFTGAVVSLLRVGWTTAVGLKIVPKLNAGETPKASYAALKLRYAKQSEAFPAGIISEVRIDGPSWVAAWGGTHELIAGEVGRTYEVTVAEECKELQFPTRPEMEGFGTSASGAGSVAATAENGVALTAAAPALATDGASLSGARAMRASVRPVGTLASLSVGGAGANDGVIYTAKPAVPGADGNAIRVAHVVAGNNTPLSVAVAGNDITVNVATNAGVLASLNVNGVNPNDGVVYTAKPLGAAGNAIRVAHVVAGINTPLSVAVAGNDITVNVATDGVGAAASTAGQVKAAIDADAGAAALVSTAVEGTGADVVVAQAMTNLAGGTDGTATSTANQVKAAVDAMAAAAALVSTAVEGTGAEVVVAQAMTALAGGADATLNAAGKLDAYRHIDGDWHRLPDLDLFPTVAGFVRYAWPELETPIPNGRIAWRPNAMTVSAGTLLNLRYEVLT